MFVAKSQTPSPFIVTGQPIKGKGTVKGWYQLKGRRKQSWRVVNTWTRKIASAEFYNLDHALLHMEMLAVAKLPLTSNR
jgi:hypothetical protein